MNQIMDHSGPKKVKAQKNPADTKNIIKIYAMILIIISIAFIGKATYALFENKKIKDTIGISAENTEPNITLHADQDIVSITVSAQNNIEEISYQWYRGAATAEDIKMAQENSNSEEVEENDDEEISAENEKVVPLGKLITEKGTGNKEMTVQNIGIPRGNTSLYIRIKTTGSSVPTEYIQNYHTDVGVDKIAPEIKVTLQGKKLLVTAKDETKISYITYSINGGTEQKIDKVENGETTIKAEIELDETQDCQIKICAVDDAKNSEIYDKTYSLYAGTPKIEFLAEEDYSIVYVKITYPKGIKKVEYSLNGKEKVEEYDNPGDKKEVNLEIKTEEGHNEIKIKAYAEEEEVYAEEVGECEYEP